MQVLAQVQVWILPVRGLEAAVQVSRLPVQRLVAQGLGLVVRV